MSNGAARDYRYGTKKHWRRWQWNQVARRLRIFPGDLRSAVGLGLLSPQLQDLSVARRHGFHLDSFIAVESDAAACKAMREAGVNTIHGRLEDVVLAWDEKLPIDYVIADFSGSFGLDTWCRTEEAMLFSNGLAAHSVISINVLRGRDARTAMFRDAIQAVLSRPGGSSFLSQIRSDVPQPELNRAFMFWFWWRGMLVTAARAQGVALPEDREGPDFHSYKSRYHAKGSVSAVNVYDSVVFRRRLQFDEHLPHSTMLEARPRIAKRSLAMRRKIAAARAIRTARLRSRGSRAS